MDDLSEQKMQAERLPGPDLPAINLLAQYPDSFLP